MENLTNSVFWGFLLFSFVICGCTSPSTFEKDITLSDEEIKALTKFKDLVKDRLPHDYMKEDIFLIKWLRYKNLDIPATERFLMKDLEWRRENGIDEILQEDFSDIEHKFKYSLESKDLVGQPVLYIDAAGMDVRGSIIQGQRKRLLRYVDKVMEEACTLVRTLGEMHKNITRGHLIINAKGYNIIEHGCLQCVPVLLQIVLAYEEHHPLCVDQILILNTPAIFAPLLEAARPLLSKDTAAKLKVIGVNKQAILDHLTKYFDMHEIPVQLGGNKVLKISDNDNDD